MIAIIDYGLGNLRSVLGAVNKVGYDALITRNEKEIRQADKLILPGVGAFGDGIQNLKKLDLLKPLLEEVTVNEKPILAICLGFQLLAKDSREFGYHKGLGLIDATVEKIQTNNDLLKVPHVGWNDLYQKKESILFDRIPSDALFYYVHSFHVNCADSSIVAGECEYGLRFTSVIEKKNIFGTQFHPEKSQLHGLRMLTNFIENT
jgi:imidazole glycerol-phosphate synthase subunit HisH